MKKKASTRAGIDFGTTLTKVAWLEDDGTYRFLSTAGPFEVIDDWKPANDPPPHERVGDMLWREGITRAHAIGIGPRRFDRISLIEFAGDPIENEIRLQSDGARRLLALEGQSLNSFLLVSVGTGVSYTRVVDGKAERFPYGSAIGGGFIAGLAKISRWSEIHEIDEKIAGARPLNLLVQDVLPSALGTPIGEFVVAHFGKDPADDRDGHGPARVMATALHVVATGIVRDVMMMQMMPEHRLPGPLVFIGSTLATFPTLVGYLEEYGRKLGFEMRFPLNGEFSAAIGALHAS